jgi:hypothetical protein
LDDTQGSILLALVEMRQRTSENPLRAKFAAFDIYDV